MDKVEAGMKKLTLDKTVEDYNELIEATALKLDGYKATRDALLDELRILESVLGVQDNDDFATGA